MKLIILNHKMNLYYEDVDNYITNINKINRNLIIAPSSIYLIEFLKKCHHSIASQDICYIDEGNQKDEKYCFYRNSSNNNDSSFICFIDDEENNNGKAIQKEIHEEESMLHTDN